MTTYHGYSPFLSFPCERWSLTHSSHRMFPPELTGSVACGDRWGTRIVIYFRDKEKKLGIIAWTNIISTWFQEKVGGAGIVVGVPLRFSKLPCSPWISHYHDFSKGNFRLLNKTHAYIQTHIHTHPVLTHSRNFFSRTSKWQRLSKVSPPSAVGKYIQSTGMRSV